MRFIAVVATVLVMLVVTVPAVGQGSYVARYDVNADYVINVQDVMLVASHWNAEISPPPPPEVYVVSSNVFDNDVPNGDPYDLLDATFVVGEVYNGSDSFVTVDSFWALYDVYGRLVDADEGYDQLTPIPPGMRGPFWNWTAGRDWADYQVGMIWYEVTQRTPLLEVLSQTTYFDEFAYFHVDGEFRNSLDVPITGIDQVVTLYDAAGEVIGVGGSYIGFGADVNPGETRTFGARVRYWEGRPDTSRVAGHALLLEGISANE